MIRHLLLLGLFSLSNCLRHQYHFIDENKTWAEAQRYCRENYVDLATVNNPEEEMALSKIINVWNRDQTWIGLHDDLNNWNWSLDDASFYKKGEKNFRNWYIQKPENLNGDSLCVYISGYNTVWLEGSCSSTRPFICFDGRVNASERYVLVNEYMNWSQAQSYCREHYTDLTSVRNDTENQIILALLFNFKNNRNYDYYGNPTAWIGLYRTRSWSDKSNSSFSNWKPGQPDSDSDRIHNGQSKYCTAVSFSDSGKWTDEKCGQTLPFLCYSTMSSTSSRQYHFVIENKTWTEAQRYCKENYTDLATIDNMKEMNTLFNTVNGSYSGLAWIGLYDDLDSWRWSLENDSFYQEDERDFRGWNQQPDNYNGHELCVSMNYEGEWFDQPCTERKTFVCYNGTKNTFVWIYYAMTWNEAQRYCRANHTDLASVRNKTELQQILSISNSSELWIGLYRNQLWSYQSYRTYRERSRQQRKTEVYAAKWRNNRCTAVNRFGEWTDENCFVSFPFICYTTFTPGAVMGLQLKFKANGNLLCSEIKRLMLMKFEPEFRRQKISRNVTVGVRNIHRLSPMRVMHEYVSSEVVERDCEISVPSVNVDVKHRNTRNIF